MRELFRSHQSRPIADPTSRHPRQPRTIRGSSHRRIRAPMSALCARPGVNSATFDTLALGECMGTNTFELRRHEARGPRHRRQTSPDRRASPQRARPLPASDRMAHLLDERLSPADSAGRPDRLPSPRSRASAPSTLGWHRPAPRRCEADLVMFRNRPSVASTSHVRTSGRTRFTPMRS